MDSRNNNLNVEFMSELKKIEKMKKFRSHIR